MFNKCAPDKEESPMVASLALSARGPSSRPSCTLCRHKFQTPIALNQHLKRQHTCAGLIFFFFLKKKYFDNFNFFDILIVDMFFFVKKINEI